VGLILDAIRRHIIAQVDAHGVVVWYDPDGYYGDVPAEISLPDATVAIYEGSYYALRHHVDGLLDGEQPPRLIVYVPLDREQTHNALIELEAAGVVLRPGQLPPDRNTSPGFVARQALRAVLPDEALTDIERQVVAGQLSLAELDRLAEKGQGLQSGLLATIYGSSLPQDVALALLASDAHDAAVAEKDALGDICALLGLTFGLEASFDSVAALRLALSRHVLASEWVSALGEIPSAMQSVSLAEAGASKVACVNLVRTWRQRDDLRESYVAHSNRVAGELRVAEFDLSLDLLSRAETFHGLESTLLHKIATALLERPSPCLLEIAAQRQEGFWPRTRPEIRAEWTLLCTCASFLAMADHIEQALKDPDLSATAILSAYTQGDEPWCMLDTHHRHLERQYQQFDLTLSHVDLPRLVARARGRYSRVAGNLAERFVRGYEQAGFELAGAKSQRQVWATYVKPQLASCKTAYFGVDGLRYDMARELLGTLDDKYVVQLVPVLATAPTITEIGMASLLPGAEAGLSLVPASGKLGVMVGGKNVRTRDERVSYLAEAAGVTVVAAKIEDLLPVPRPALQQRIREAGLVLVTSQEIDELCETDNVPLARRVMDELLHELRRAFRVLTDLGVQRIVLTADHGYLLGEALESDMKIEAPGGETIVLHRRVWVGRGGMANPAVMRAPLAALSVGTDLEIVIPYGLGGLKTPGGALSYFHGGLSPQELFIPVGILQTRGLTGTPGGAITWGLRLGGAKITMRLFSATVEGHAETLFDPDPPKVRLELRREGRAISRPFGASYGFEAGTGDVQLRMEAEKPHSLAPAMLAVMLDEGITNGRASLHLLDAISGVELVRLPDIEISILT
jgi:hypothetical protein